ncbi:RNA transcription, translation and transport factor protein-like [Ptychodera flava]|uniref:RNA transcription, translation and transport factor protein-like n=1 Tax=Ptychodera flava TaxID=63121 RepID=UPI00396A4881
MFKRKLYALDHHSPESVDITDEKQWRNLIVWLEDQKIRLYKIEERSSLRNVGSSEWPTAFGKFLTDLQCPVDPMERTAVLDWLLGHAVRLVYGEDVEKYKNAKPVERSADGKPKVASDDPFQHLDVNSPEFKSGLISLATQLNMPRHENPVVMLKAIAILIQDRLSKDAIAKADKKDEGMQLQLKEVDAGFEIRDPALLEAAKVLRLLHIQDLRELQTKINETIVGVQSITANPKTDQRLGKVGR